MVEESEQCSVTALQNTLNIVQTAFPANDIIVDTYSEEPFYYPLPSTVLSVIVRNFVRNAVIHGESTKIKVDMHADRITVSNSVNPNQNTEKGFGIGLSIVQRICERFDCELNSGLRNDDQYFSSVVFSDRITDRDLWRVF